MKFFKERDIIGILQKDCFTGKKIDPLRLQAGLQLYETLSFSQGKAFEPYIKEILPNIMNCIADAKEPVRACANAANQQIIRNFSNYAIKQVVPMFLEGLKTDNWRGKYAAVEAVGNMAHCAPKQISGFLPDIVKALREVLNDTHPDTPGGTVRYLKSITGQPIEQTDYKWADAVTTNLEAFAHSARGEAPYPFAPEQMVHNIEVLEAITISAEDRKTVYMKDI